MEFIGIETIDDLILKYSAMYKDDLSEHFFDNLSRKRVDRKKLIDSTLMSLEFKGRARSPQEEKLYKKLLEESAKMESETRIASGEDNFEKNI